MATYTMRLHEYIEQATQYETGLSTSEKIEVGRKKLFDFDYPIFDEDYRNVFETHFIRNFFMREIGFETEGLFKFQLETWLQINMPYFNQLFKSELLEFDPLINTEVDESYTKVNDRKQSDERDITQNETGNETGNQDRTGNTSETGTRDSSVDHTSDTTDTKDSTIDQTSDTTGSTDSISSNDSTTDTTSNRQTDGTNTDDNFNRKIYADTPDDRLALTTNDGEGTLEYASNIEENNENNQQTQSETTDTTTNTTSSDTATNGTDTTSNTTGQSIEDTDETSNTVQNTVEDTDTTNNRDETENLSTTTDRTNDTTRNDKNTSTINDVEDYIYKKRGNIGTQTYSHLLNEYRQTFLRIEKEIFKEMNAELFMLVY